MRARKVRAVLADLALSWLQRVFWWSAVVLILLCIAGGGWLDYDQPVEPGDPGTFTGTLSPTEGASHEGR